MEDPFVHEELAPVTTTRLLFDETLSPISARPPFVICAPLVRISVVKEALDPTKMLPAMLVCTPSRILVVPSPTSCACSGSEIMARTKAALLAKIANQEDAV